MTNYEYIKNMSIEELAEFLITYDFTRCPPIWDGKYQECYLGCDGCFEEWLKSEEKGLIRRQK